MKDYFSNESLVILDCTLRDGGYNNSWDFSPQIVSRYLQSMKNAGVDAIEIGFRYPPRNKFLGAFAYSTDHFLQKLSLPDDRLICVMTDAKDFINYPGGPKKAVKSLFDKECNSALNMVRICSYLENIGETKDVPEELKKLGYKTCLNLMQVSEKSKKTICSTVKKIEQWGTVDILYFADSLGAMDTEDVREMIEVIRENWTGAIGVHAHDNKGRGLANTLAAIDAGATWADGTVLGMGRGAGNARIEHLLVELQQRGFDQYDPVAVFTIVMDDFKQLRDENEWGYNLLYYLSANYGIHPTYVQEMIGELQYSTPQMLEGIETLKKWGANAYNSNRFHQAMLGNSDDTEGTWSAKKWLENRDVLLLAAGPKGKKHTCAVIEFIDRFKPFVISLNADTDIPTGKIDAFAVCHYTRLLTELDRYHHFSTPMLMPYGILPDAVRKLTKGLKIFDYGMQIKSDTFEIREKGCVIPGFLIAPYVFAAVTIGGANRILLSGFDGYSPGDPRQEEMVEVINLYNSSRNPLPLIAITPSTYDVEHSSVYSQNILQL